jgi:hypothetical protein
MATPPHISRATKLVYRGPDSYGMGCELVEHDAIFGAANEAAAGVLPDDPRAADICESAMGRRSPLSTTEPMTRSAFSLPVR